MQLLLPGEENSVCRGSLSMLLAVDNNGPLASSTDGVSWIAHDQRDDL